MDRRKQDAAVFASKTADLVKIWEWCKRRASKRGETVSVPTGKGTTEVILQPGQFVFGRHSAAKEIPGLTASGIRRRMEKLRQMSILATQTAPHYTLVTLCDPKTYKEPDQASGHPSDQASDHPTGHPTDQATQYKFPVCGQDEPWVLMAAKLAEYQETYPHLDVGAELREAVQWCRDHESRQKTPRGMHSFLGGWLQRAQNRGKAVWEKPRAPDGRVH